MSRTNKLKNVILDLDQTIISGESYDELDRFSEGELSNKMKHFRHSHMKGYYRIFERPGLQDFLDYLFANFNVSVWTAASKEYALFIIRNIVINRRKHRKLDYVLYAKHCDHSRNKYKSIKKLCMLWKTYKIDGYNDNNTIIIDDNNEVFSAQTKNCIHIKPFKFQNKNSHTDTELQVVMTQLSRFKDSSTKKSLSSAVKTIRPTSKTKVDKTKVDKTKSKSNTKTKSNTRKNK